jgi:Tfp pilus assembly protein PilO
MKAPTGDRAWLTGGLVGLLLLAALAWLMLIHPELSKANSLRAQRSDAETQNIVLQAKTAKLAKQDADRSSLQSDLRASSKELPSDNGLADFTRSLTDIAARTGSVVSGITAGTTALTTSSGVPSSSTGTDVDAGGQLYSIPITLNVQGGTSAELKFLSALQAKGTRAVLINSVGFAPGAAATTASLAGSTTMTIQLQAFVSTLSPAAQKKLDTLSGKSTSTSS